MVSWCLIARVLDIKQFHIQSTCYHHHHTTMFSTLHIVAINIVLALGLTALWRTSPGSRTFRRFLHQQFALLAGRTLPDFSQLTGFPHPKPIHHFNIAHARPRPYRPFRWEYHQNMCMRVASLNTLRSSVPFHSSQEVGSRLLAGTGEYLS